MPTENPDAVFAHSSGSDAAWELLSTHLMSVGDGAERNARAFALGTVARAAGVLHDIGKASVEFQAYIRGQGPSPDHSTAGAVMAGQLYRGVTARMLAYIIAGHHAGLADGTRLAERLGRPYPACEGWKEHTAPLPSDALLTCPLPSAHPDYPGFADAFMIRMLFSALVDADFTETERYCAAAARPPRRVDRGGFSSIEDLAARLQTYLAQLPKDDTPVNRLRAGVQAHAVSRAGQRPGLFTLTVPTGGGKTLTSLAFALAHAKQHGLRRVVYVIPYTSIVDQTAQVFRTAFGDSDVLEHTASFDWEDAERKARERDGGQGDAGLARLRRAAENWDAPVIVTTAVQFFESLYAHRTSRCRKLHNLAGSVIVLDEAQTLPLPLLRPCLAVLDELARNYGASVVLCTATQPAIRTQDRFKGGLNIPGDRELAPDPPELYRALHRVTIERRAGETTDAEIAARFAEVPQMMAIVNSRAHARDLFGLIRHLPGAVHLTTLMCPLHRRTVLAGLVADLKGGVPVRLAATSLVEAGVDISLPEVWRASAGLESVLQAAGRCNRNDELAALGRKGRVVVFDPGDTHKPPHAMRAFQEAAASVFRRHQDPQTLEAVRDYFGQLYWSKGAEAFDAARLEGEVFPILQRIAEGKSARLFPFESIARAFRMIDTTMISVAVPYGTAGQDLLDRCAFGDGPVVADLRRLQQYIVPVPERVCQAWLVQGVLAPVHKALGQAVLKLTDPGLYDAQMGLSLGDAFRTAESNVM